MGRIALEEEKKEGATELYCQRRRSARPKGNPEIPSGVGASRSKRRRRAAPVYA